MLTPGEQRMLTAKITHLQKELREKDTEISGLKVQIEKLTYEKSLLIEENKRLALNVENSSKGSHKYENVLPHSSSTDVVNNNNISTKLKDDEIKWKEIAERYQRDLEDTEDRLKEALDFKFELEKDHLVYQKENAELRSQAQLNETLEKHSKLREAASLVKEDCQNLINENSDLKKRIESIVAKNAEERQSLEHCINDITVELDSYKFILEDVEDVFTKIFQSLTNNQRKDSAKIVCSLFNFAEVDAYAPAARVFNYMITTSFTTSYSAFEGYMKTATDANGASYGEDVVQLIWRSLLLQAVKAKLVHELQPRKIPLVPTMKHLNFRDGSRDSSQPTIERYLTTMESKISAPMMSQQSMLESEQLKRRNPESRDHNRPSSSGLQSSGYPTMNSGTQPMYSEQMVDLRVNKNDVQKANIPLIELD